MPAKALGENFAGKPMNAVDRVNGVGDKCLFFILQQ